MEQVSIRLPKDLVEKLQNTADKYSISLSALIRMILTNFILAEEAIDRETERIVKPAKHPPRGGGEG